MKLKIRGLVFTGFAAAVFATSALAVTPPSELDPSDPDLKKTVTSQDYVDETFQERLAGDPTTSPATALEEDELKGVTEKAAFIGWNYGQGGIDKEWVKLEGNKQIGDGNSAKAYVQIRHNTVNSADEHFIEMNDEAIADISGKIGAAGVDTATDLEKARLTTAKAVYDFVTGYTGDEYQPKAQIDNHEGGLSTVGAATAGVGVRTGSGETNDPYVSTWYGLAAGQDGLQIVSNVEDHPYARIYRDDRNSGGYGPGVYVDLNHNRIAVASTYNGSGTYVHNGIVAAGASPFTENGMALTTAGAVYELLDREGSGGTTTITAASTNNVVPTSKNVFDFVTSVTNGNTLPTMDSACIHSGVHCALVTVYDPGTTVSNPSLQPGDTGYVAPSATLEWTVMAQGA